MKESESVYLKFRKLKKEVDVDIREEKIKLYHSIITKSSNKQKATWNLVNSVKGTHKNTAIRELVYENITITHSADIANAFGRHVSTIIEKNCPVILVPYLSHALQIIIALILCSLFLLQLRT
nr:unnamed protein product [Callosobruchus analis]